MIYLKLIDVYFVTSDIVIVDFFVKFDCYFINLLW